MGTYRELRWQGRLDVPGRKNQLSGKYRAYLPDELVGAPLRIAAETAQRSALLERQIRQLNDSETLIGVDALARLLVRREAVASSYIEGLEVNAQRLAIAQLDAQMGLHRDSDDARGIRHNSPESDVVANIRVVERAAGDLSEQDHIGVDDFIALQSELVRDESLHGLRSSQNWVGGNSYHPLDAEYVPPPAEDVPRLMADLANYMMGASHGALIQAGLVHAQFETIHPFADGNGRVGRALIHTVIRRHFGQKAILLPISAALATRSDAYTAGLMKYRSSAEAGSDAWQESIDKWLHVFFDATQKAIDVADTFSARLEALTHEWQQRHETAFKGRSRALRRDSTAVQIREALPALPVFTISDFCSRLGKTETAVRNGCETLVTLGIIKPLNLGKNRRGWWAPELFAIFDEGEHSLSQTNWSIPQRD